MTRFIGLLALIGVGACSRPLIAPTKAHCPGICSEGSSYSPTMRLFVTTTSTADVLKVIVDSGLVRVPGSPAAGASAPVVMEQLYLRAFVAADLHDHTDAAREHAWRVLAWSDSVPLASVMRYGESMPLSTLQFQFRLDAGELGNAAWLGFAITGAAINPRATTPAQRLMRGGVRVFVCDMNQLNGSQDVSRVSRLRDNYSAAC